MSGPTVTVTIKIDLRQWKGLMVSIRTALAVLDMKGSPRTADQLRESLEPLINCPGVRETLRRD